MEKIIIFGAGKFYENRRNQFFPDIEIVAFIDNDHQLYGKYIDRKPITLPNQIEQFSYDKIVLMSIKTNADEMKEQLIRLGVDEKKIWLWEEFKKDMGRGRLKLYSGNKELIEGGKKVLIISTYLHYNGATVVIAHAAEILQKRGYNIVLAAPGGTYKYVNEMNNKGINVVICPSLPYLHQEEFFWIQQFDLVLVNVFQMIQCACEISKVKPVLWWIHEPKELYEETIYQFNEYANLDNMSKINIYAVSSIARKNFNSYFPERINATLGFGIPDENVQGIRIKNKKDITFAIIGAVFPLKAQDTFIRAIELLDEDEKKDVQFWIVGSIWESDYSNEIKRGASKEPSIKILGELTRDEMNKAYADIDVVVCPSLEETVSLAIVEGMMHGKVCVTSDAVGMADYIIEGKNGFIHQVGDYVTLSEKMKWIIKHRNKISEIGIHARKTYEEHFTLEKFADRLESAIINTIEKRDKNICPDTEYK